MSLPHAIEAFATSITVTVMIQLLQSLWYSYERIVICVKCILDMQYRNVNTYTRKTAEQAEFRTGTKRQRLTPVRLSDRTSYIVIRTGRALSRSAACLRQASPKASRMARESGLSQNLHSGCH